MLKYYIIKCDRKHSILDFILGKYFIKYIHIILQCRLLLFDLVTYSDLYIVSMLPGISPGLFRQGLSSDLAQLFLLDRCYKLLFLSIVMLLISIPYFDIPNMCIKLVCVIIISVLLDIGFFKGTPLRLIFVSSLQIFLNHNDDEECR